VLTAYRKDAWLRKQIKFVKYYKFNFFDRVKPPAPAGYRFLTKEDIKDENTFWWREEKNIIEPINRYVHHIGELAAYNYPVLNGSGTHWVGWVRKID
jgi:hypothetical protein